MTTKKGLTGQALKAFRSNVAKLKSKGLVSAKVDARKQRPTRHMQEKVKKFSPVLKGEAKVIHASTRKQARALGEIFGSPQKNMSVGKAVVVPVNTKNARVVLVKGKGRGRNREDDKVRVYHKENGRKLVSEFQSGARDNLHGLPVGPGISYRITFFNGQTHTEDTLQGLAEFMYPYEIRPSHSWKNWRRFIEVIRADDGEE